jgi:hypothetical protein
MASPHQLPPQVGDSTNLLLKKLVTATQALSSGGGVFLTEAEADALYFRLNGSNNPFTATSLTVATVRDGFSLTSEGSIDLAAGGTNENITITPSGTGNFLVATSTTGKSLFGNSLSGTDVASRVFNLIDTAAVARVWRVSADSTTASPAFELMHGTTNLAASRDVYWDMRADTVGMAIRDRNGAGVLKRLLMTVGGTVQIPGNGAAFCRVAPAWGATGIQFDSQASVNQDTTSSGTVAAIVNNSFGIPTFASISSATFTNAANVYIAGDPVAQVNATLTNSYGLWNVGKTRLDGPVAAPAGITASTLEVGGTMAVNAVGFAPTISSRRFNGTSAAPTAVTTGQTILNVLGGGATAAATFTGASAGLSMFATENWGVASAGSQISFVTTPNGSLTNASRLVIDQDGGIKVPSTNTVGLQLYNTVDQVTNYERGIVKWTSNVLEIGSEYGGSAAARAVRFGVATVGGTTITASGKYFQATSGGLFAVVNTQGAAGNGFSVTSTNALTSGTSNAVAITPTYNQASGTAANTDLLINRAETAVGSGSQRFIDAQVGGSTRFALFNNGVASFFPHTATPAGGSTSARIVFGSTSGFGIYIGSGAPSVSAGQGSLYLRSDGSSTSTRLYVNTDGAAAWTNMVSAT